MRIGVRPRAYGPGSTGPRKGWVKAWFASLWIFTMRVFPRSNVDEQPDLVRVPVAALRVGESAASPAGRSSTASHVAGRARSGQPAPRRLFAVAWILRL